MSTHHTGHALSDAWNAEPLFDLEQTVTTCAHPNLAASTGYRYGCRCTRCRDGKIQSPSQTCKRDDCERTREKHRQYCSDHAPDVGSTRRRAQQCEAPCEICRRPHRWYESSLEASAREELRDLYRRTCSACRSAYMGVIKAHRLDASTALRLITAKTCELCRRPFPITDRGRAASVIDHDHACCAGARSCGACVRGIVCHRCNHAIAQVETVRDIGLDRVIAYLEALAVKGRPPR